ncbi:HAMP domain-containing histidine kinase [Nocardioides euryhalodurans]|uniref:histidine kinase n=2 Tax=Nocardioides euryhalodurans TaxID=2518370 RepID=A0A4V1BDL8_9ACTN|nr:HAMP domain-containing histidine kinase [Nocardioides euryhalodurans]
MMTTMETRAATTPTTSRATTERATADRPSPRRTRTQIPVRIRIAATIAVVTAMAMAAAGLLVFVLESTRIDSSLNQQIDQEIAEFRALEDGTDPATGEPFADVGRLLSLFIDRNVTDDDEMLLTYVDGEARQGTPNQFGDSIRTEPVFRDAIARLLETGGTEVIDSPRFDEVWVTVVPVDDVRDPRASGALAIVNFADDERSELNRTIQTYGIVTLCFLGLITLLALWRSGRLLAPLTTLRTTAESIGETDLSLRIPEQGNDDLTALTRTLNDMLARLELAFVGQRQFLDDAGHELKTPLTVLQGHLELLDADDPQEVAETRLLLLDEVDRMSRLVGDMILLAKSDRPDFVSPAPVSLERLTHTLLSKARGLADRDWDLDQVGEGIVELDEQRITQAVLQLADNAVKHTAPGDTIALGSAWDAEGARLWVRDTGPGVPETDRQHIFERFGRSVVGADDEGFGLGLAIVDAIARAHRGRVDLADDPPPGATFVITLPSQQEVPWPAS